ncbi:hypothetical protein LAC81_31735 [Ensifer adhaerens]|uniref:hypothetical protein n=1 Tax=Ensifer adhaerens TaxID=106592 RepID=UPI001CBDFBF1|nr:hypothetical protein [Ensifer adhaerens]MBZ7925316.1 hypothetical protein [Ensifer adhaerens]UAX95511.1 hypothetical protein LAC78_32095 [Ensifer adhaerens]UAY02597.1 hypothetical protein LAC80_28215 [Ensifer adhaerens]UAY10581.1 hypothetical protein LAC81_31735 [Ensifer adhaerens]
MEKVRTTYLRLLMVLKLAIALSLALLPFSTASGMMHAAAHGSMQIEASVNSTQIATEHCPSLDKGKAKPAEQSGKTDKKDCCKTFCAAVAVLGDVDGSHPAFPRSIRNFGPLPQITQGELDGLHRPPRA